QVDSLSSNCQLLDRHLDTLFEYRDVITYFRPSLDSASKDVYEKIRVGGTWEILHRNLLAFTERNAASPNPFPIKVNNIVSADNYHELAFIPQVFSYLAPPSQFGFGFVNSLSPDNEYFFKTRLIDKTVLNKPCSLPFRSAYILKEGSFSLCCRDYHGEVTFGSIRDNDEDVKRQHKERRDAIRRAHVSGKQEELPHLCQTCYGVDPRLDSLMSSLFAHFFQTVKGHPARLQDFLNRSLPALKAGDYSAYTQLLETL
ncbi:MAG: hypothetical protein EPN26_07360, partial [Rhodospirillales bacterium]